MNPAATILEPGRLEWSLQLPVQAQSRLFSARWEREGAGADEILRIARKADESGCFAVAVCDHVAIPTPWVETMGSTWYDPVATLGVVGGATNRVRLMTHVLVLAYRHPLVSAKALATLDRMTGGRVIAGVGAGHVEDEFAALGVAFDRRGALLDESIDVLAAALADDEPEITTSRFSVSGVAVAPRPVQRPRPPIWVGGSSEAALRRAAERGDGWLPQGTPRDEMPGAIAFLREHRRAVRGDDPVDITSMTEPLYVGEPSWDVGPRTLTGSPEVIAKSLREFRDVGVGNLMVGFRVRSCDELEDQIEAFAHGVAPMLND